MSKITKTQLNNLKNFIDASRGDNYVLKASDWTTGSGRYTKTKSLPPFVKEFKRSDFDYKTAEQTVYGGTTVYPTAKNGQGLRFGTIERAAGNFFIANQRVQKVFVLDFDAMISALHGVEI